MKFLPLGFPAGARAARGAAAADIIPSILLKVVLMNDPVSFETLGRFAGAEDERLLQANNTATACHCFNSTNRVPVPIRCDPGLCCMAEEIPLVSSLQRGALED